MFKLFLFFCFQYFCKPSKTLLRTQTYLLNIVEYITNQADHRTHFCRYGFLPVAPFFPLFFLFSFNKFCSCQAENFTFKLVNVYSWLFMCFLVGLNFRFISEHTYYFLSTLPDEMEDWPKLFCVLFVTCWPVIPVIFIEKNHELCLKIQVRSLVSYSCNRICMLMEAITTITNWILTSAPSWGMVLHCIWPQMQQNESKG